MTTYSCPPMPAQRPPERGEAAPLRAAVVQLRLRTGRAADNLHRAGASIRAACQQGARLVVLPEAFMTSLDLPRSREIAQPVPGPLTQWLAERAREEGVYLVAGVLERAGEEVHSTAVLIDDQGRLLLRYRRNNVFDLEAHFLTPGRTCQVADTPLGRIGLILGYDVHFPETARQLCAQGVEILACPAVLLLPFADSIRQMARARAAENCCYLLLASATGENTLAGLTYMGGSAILQSPVGIQPFTSGFRKQEAVLAEAGRDEALLTAELDLVALRRGHALTPLLKDFRRGRLFPALAGGAEPPEEG